MKKQSYLNDKNVIGLTEFLHNCLLIFPHSYINRRSHKIWSCNNLIEAVENYKWHFSYKNPTDTKITKGSKLIENEKSLKSLSDGIKSAYKSKNNQELLNYSIAICKWGGVLGSEKYGNQKTLIANSANLFDLYSKTQKVITNDELKDKDLRNIFNMNSGFTKIYSLLFDNLIIYDSRVGAALCWLVKIYCAINNISEVPQSLNFTWAPSKEGENAANPKNRNPGKYLNRDFLCFAGIPDAQSRSMILSSWLIEKFVKNNNKIPGNTTNEKMRSFEAALFMIGYDIPKKDDVDLNFQYCTKGGENQKKYFNVNTTKSGIKISNNEGRIISYSFGEIKNILDSLYIKFNKNWFPLSNNVEKIYNLTAEDGLGKTIFEITKNNIKAQGSSYLGAYLEELGILIFSKAKSKISKKSVIGWKINNLYTDISINDLIEEYINS
jgi:hypothetical protein